MDAKINEEHSLEQDSSWKNSLLYKYVLWEMKIAEYQAILDRARDDAKEERNREIAQKMLELNQPDSLISQVTGYTESEIKAIAATL